MDHYKLFIDGEFVDASDKKRFETIDPGTGKPFATVARAGAAEAEAAIGAARQAFETSGWKDLDPAERSRRVMDFADRLGQEGAKMALAESMDSGGVIARTGAEILLIVGTIRNLAHYAATRFPWHEEIAFSGNPFFPGRNYIRREPIGVCVGIVPWNFPLNMAVWKVAHAIIMGNSMVLKPATNTPLTALMMGEIAQKSQIPRGVFNVVAGPGEELGKILCTHPHVDHIGFTGSTEVGRQIQKLGADTIKTVSLELGGKSANIITDEADLDLAVDGAIFGTFYHSGQVCESGTRILVQASRYDEFLERFIERIKGVRIGYQLDASSQMGPLISGSQMDAVASYVQAGKQEGAELVHGGGRMIIPGFENGYYFAPTVFANVDNRMRIAQEEIFGPVVCVIKYEEDEEAVAIANDSVYGLAGGVWSKDIGRAERIAAGVQTGTMWINDYHAFGDFTPFGGYKQSGRGRELGFDGLAEYTETKRVHLGAHGDPSAKMGFQTLLDYPKTASFQFVTPTKINSGTNSLATLAHEISLLGSRAPFILADAGVTEAGLTEKVRKATGDSCVGIFHDIPQDSDFETVDRAADAAKRAGADLIISVGGGSVLDTAKWVTIILREGGRAIDHYAFFRLTRKPVPHIAIATTSGTGSEVTNAAVVTHRGLNRKCVISDAMIYPEVAILDPGLMVTLPRGLTASTAFDALTHACEAMMSKTANPISDGLSLQAIRLINQNLLPALENGHDTKARSALQVAAAMAGMSFTVAVTTFAHAMAHTVGALYDVPHGAACAVCLPVVMRFNAEYATDALIQIAQAFEVDIRQREKGAAAMAAADAVEALLKKSGIPNRLRDLGVPEEGLAQCAFHSLGDVNCFFNPRPVSDPNEVMKLFQQAY